MICVFFALLWYGLQCVVVAPTAHTHFFTTYISGDRWVFGPPLYRAEGRTFLCSVEWQSIDRE